MFCGVKVGKNKFGFTCLRVCLKVFQKIIYLKASTNNESETKVVQQKLNFQGVSCDLLVQLFRQAKTHVSCPFRQAKVTAIKNNIVQIVQGFFWRKHEIKYKSMRSTWFCCSNGFEGLGMIKTGSNHCRQYIFQSFCQMILLTLNANLSDFLVSRQSKGWICLWTKEKKIKILFKNWFSNDYFNFSYRFAVSCLIEW